MTRITSLNDWKNHKKINENLDSLPFVLSNFRSDINVASQDKHDIVSAYEEVISSYKEQYPQFSNELDAEWNKMNLEAEKEMDNLKPKNTNEDNESGDNKFTYMMLGRLQSDNDYFLGNGARSPMVLWAHNVDAQIAEMKRLWNSLPEDAKPQWLSMEDILSYEEKMKEPLTNENSSNDLEKTFSDKKGKNPKANDFIKDENNNIGKIKSFFKDGSNEPRMVVDFNSHTLELNPKSKFEIINPDENTKKVFDNVSTNESTPGVAAKFTEDELKQIATAIGVESVSLNDSGLPEFGGGEFTLVKHSDGFIEMLRYDDTTSEFKEFKSYENLQALLEDLKDNKFQNESFNESKDTLDVKIKLGENDNINHMITAINKHLPKDKKVKISDFKDIKSFDEIDSFDLDDIYSDVKKVLSSKGYTFRFIKFDDNDKFNYTLKNKLIKENLDTATNSLFTFKSVEDMYDDQKQYIMNELQVTLDKLKLTPDTINDLEMFTNEDALLQGKQNEFFKFKSMLPALYPQVLAEDGNKVYDFNGVNVWIEDKAANYTIYLNKNDNEKFNYELNNLVNSN